MKVFSYNFGGLLGTIGAAILAIGLIDFSQPSTPQSLGAIFNGSKQEIIVAGIVTITIGVMIVLIRFLTDFVSSLTDKAVGAISVFRNDYFINYGGSMDLPELYKHYTKLFGQDIVPQNQMASWLMKNQSILTRVLKVNKRNVQSTPELIGFFDIEPLTRRGENKMRSAKASAMQLKKEDIHSGKVGQPNAYYVGSVGCPKGMSNFLKGICMVFFILRIKELSYGRSIVVFARPVSDSGLYLVKELFKMKKIGNGADKEAIWTIDIDSKTYSPPAQYIKIARRAGLEI